MNRSDETLFDPRIAIWLEDDPNLAPDQALDVVLAAFPSIKQRRAWRVPWRIPDMSPLSKFVAIAAAVAVVVVGAYLLLPRVDSSIGAPPTASPSPSTSPSPGDTQSPTPALLNTSTWVEYTSDRYGFTIARPENWAEEPADHDWTIENDFEPGSSTGTESFYNEPAPGMGVKFSAWSTAVAPGTTLEAWIQTYCTATGGTDCSRGADRAVDFETGDQHRGLGFFGPDKDTIAFFQKGDRVYVAAIWRGETDPSVTRYGGARRLLESFLSTMTLGTSIESPAPSP